MNQRIEQLLKQSMEDLPRPDYHKFAKLIVQECVGVADHSTVNGTSIIGNESNCQ